ncbi:alcohol oxidase-like protein [Coniochaeta sp. 2T2.1]|nr:alcohol oxidase-like protein [Coniochaeta sp. 2T2.1]
MGLYTTLPDGLEEVDVIIAGGGTAGCIIASRIASALPSLSLLLVEGGSNNTGPTISTPLLFLSHLDPNASTNIMYTTAPEPQLAGRQLSIPAGGVLGGGSSINMMTYSRALLRDWDAWDMEGWKGKDMLPFLKMTETYLGPGDKSTHGTSGPIQVSPGPFASPRAADQFMEAAEFLGFPKVDDLNDLVTAYGVQRSLRFISPVGVRQDVATQYLKPRLEDGKHPNLHVLLEHQVVRVFFEGKRAVGVEVVANPKVQPGKSSEARSIRAKKMVVVSSGAYGTPPVLERSGIGSKEVLRRAGVDVVADLPGVGKGYHDHSLVMYEYHTSLEPSETLNAAVANPEFFGKWMQEGNPITGWNGQEVSFKLRPTESDVSNLGENFQRFWDSNFKHGPPRALTQGALVMASLTDPSPARQNILTSNFPLYSESRGHIHITGPRTTDPLDFKSGILTDAEGIDLTAHVWAYKTQREILRRMPVYRGELAITHPKFPPGSASACVDLDTHDAEAVKSLEYTAEDDRAIEQWVREHVSTAWHPLGTCKMAPREKGGVVDKDLSVYGVQGLKVADLSIAPGGISANTANTAMAVGERAADIFIRELSKGLDA